MIITNGFDKPQSFAAAVSGYIESCERACIVSAFFCRDTEVKILNNAGKNVSLVVSLRPPTCPKALSRVLLMSNVEVRFLGRELHSKIYAFSSGDPDSWQGATYQAAVGSSNMTEMGWFKNIETNVLLGGEQAQVAYQQAEAIFQHARILDADTLDRYKESLSHYEEPVFDDIDESEGMLEQGFSRIKQAVRHVSELCRTEIEASYPDIPPSLVVDHFWHYIVVILRGEREKIKSRALNNEDSDSFIRELFARFLAWELQDKYCREMYRRSNELRELLGSGRTPNREELESIYLTFHASRYIEQRYTGKAEGFLARNSPEQIMRSLRHLSDETLPFGRRVKDLQSSPWALHNFGDSAIKEFNGWYHPGRYPIWNTKSEKALELLGFA
ncbi:TPA: phospholipase D family protein [Vibrio parahaemolyticus]|nr:phospholipase D family protein [Vibrio parahaemolyticus]